jgi:hypothetical protein
MNKQISEGQGRERGLNGVRMGTLQAEANPIRHCMGIWKEMHCKAKRRPGEGSFGSRQFGFPDAVACRRGSKELKRYFKNT